MWRRCLRPRAQPRLTLEAAHEGRGLHAAVTVLHGRAERRTRRKPRRSSPALEGQPAGGRASRRKASRGGASGLPQRIRR